MDAAEIPFKDLKLFEVIGSGGQGQVFRGDWNGGPVAVKRLNSGDDGRQELVRMMTAAMRCDRVCRVFGFSRHGANLYIVMPLMVSSLEELIRTKFPNGVPLDLFLTIAEDLFEGLTQLHQTDVVHCDVKPANVLVSDEGRAFLSDLGLAVRASKNQLAGSGAMACGTDSYMAPEQWNPNIGDTLPASDVWCASATLVHAASGEPPFAGWSLQRIMRAVCEQGACPQVPKAVPEPLAGAMYCAFHRDGAMRPTAESMLHATRATAAALRGLSTAPAPLVMCSGHGALVPHDAVARCSGTPGHWVCRGCFSAHLAALGDGLASAMAEHQGRFPFRLAGECSGHFATADIAAVLRPADRALFCRAVGARGAVVVEKGRCKRGQGAGPEQQGARAKVTGGVLTPRGPGCGAVDVVEDPFASSDDEETDGGPSPGAAAGCQCVPPLPLVSVTGAARDCTWPDTFSADGAETLRCESPPQLLPVTRTSPEAPRAAAPAMQASPAVAPPLPELLFALPHPAAAVSVPAPPTRPATVPRPATAPAAAPRVVPHRSPSYHAHASLEDKLVAVVSAFSRWEQRVSEGLHAPPAVGLIMSHDDFACVLACALPGQPVDLGGRIAAIESALRVSMPVVVCNGILIGRAQAKIHVTCGAVLQLRDVYARGVSVAVEDGEAVLTDAYFADPSSGLHATGPKSQLRLQRGMVQGAGASAVVCRQGAAVLVAESVVCAAGRCGVAAVGWGSRARVCESRLAGAAGAGVVALNGGWVEALGVEVMRTGQSCVLSEGPKSIVEARDCVIRAGLHGASCQRGGAVDLHGCRISAVTGVGVMAIDRGSRAAMVSTTMSDTGLEGMLAWAHGSVGARDSSVLQAQRSGVRVGGRGSMAALNNVTILQSATDGIEVCAGGWCHCEGAVVTGARRAAVRASGKGAAVKLVRGELSSAPHGVSCADGGRADLRGTRVMRCAVGLSGDQKQRDFFGRPRVTYKEILVGPDVLVRTLGC